VKKKPIESKVYGLLDDIEEVDVMPKQKINKTSLPKGSENVNLDNVVRINEAALKKILARTDKASRHIAADLLENEIPVMLSYDNATAYAETVLRDGLNIDVEIDDDVTRVLSYLNKLSIIYQYSTMVKLPKAIRKIFVEEIAKAFIPEAIADMQKATNSRKYSQHLRELTAHVQSKEQNKEHKEKKVSKHGVKKSRGK